VHIFSLIMAQNRTSNFKRKAVSSAWSWTKERNAVLNIYSNPFIRSNSEHSHSFLMHVLTVYNFSVTNASKYSRFFNKTGICDLACKFNLLDNFIDIKKCKINNWKERSKNRADWERAIKEAKVRIGL
jgi:hypothetical protein